MIDSSGRTYEVSSWGSLRSRISDEKTPTAASALMTPMPAMKVITMIASHPAVDGLVRRGGGR